MLRISLLVQSRFVAAMVVAVVVGAAALTPRLAADRAKAATQPLTLPRILSPRDTLVTVDRTAGGLNTVSPSTSTIVLRWPAVEHAEAYWVFRSEQPAITLGWGPLLIAKPTSPSYTDNKVERGKRYYYAIVSVPDSPRGKVYLVAMGAATGLREDEPAAKAAATAPSTDGAYLDLVPREEFDAVQADRDEKARLLTDAQNEIDRLKEEIKKYQAAQR